jgi:tetratricopeptide (TPR) repeat protein
MTERRNYGKGSMMNSPSVWKLIVAVFFLTALPVPGQIHDKVLFSANLLAKDHAKTKWSEHALALEKLKDWQGLLDWCRKWTKSEPELATAWVSLGRAYYRLDRYNDAIEAYRQAIRRKPDDADAYFNRGMSYLKLTQYQRAVEDFGKTIRLKPDNADAYFNRGLSHVKLDQYQRAIEDFGKTINLQPDNAVANNLRGLAYITSGNKPEGCSSLIRACKLGICREYEFWKQKGYCR